MSTSETDGESRKLTGFATGEWTVSPARNLLLRGHEQVHVEPRVMDVLVHLVDHAGSVVPKDELVERIWEGRSVSEDVLTVTIYALRKALGDDARRPRYLETIPRRGYRWIGPARCEVPATVSATVGTEESRSRPVPWRALAATVVLSLFTVVAVSMLTFSRRSRHVPTDESHEAYIKGRYFLDQRSIKGWQAALTQFERAVAVDPQSSAAHAGLADTYSSMSDFGVASPAEMRPRAMTESQRALELDPQSAEGHAALGRAQFLFDWDFAGAERSLSRALVLDPDYMPAYQSMAWLQSARGRNTEAIAAARRALQLDPVNTARYIELAWVLALAGRYEESLREIDRALQLNPRSAETYLMKGWTLEMSGQPDAAFASFREALRILGVPEESLARAEAVYRAEGLPGYYRGWLEHGGRSSASPMSDTFRAMLCARAGQTERAILSLQQAYQKRESALAWVNVEPSFRVLRSDARFQKIAAQVGHRDQGTSAPD